MRLAAAHITIRPQSVAAVRLIALLILAATVIIKPLAQKFAFIAATNLELFVWPRALNLSFMDAFGRRRQPCHLVLSQRLCERFAKGPALATKPDHARPCAASLALTKSKRAPEPNSKLLAMRSTVSA